MQSLTSTLGHRRERRDQREIKRLTPADYSKAGILKAYDWSVKDREAHDREMEKYRHYLMKLCRLSSEIDNLGCDEGVDEW